MNYGRWYFSEHFFLSELSDFSDCSGCSLLELNLVQSLVEIHGVVSGDWLKFLFLSVLDSWHFLN